MRIIDRLIEYLQYKGITAYSFERTCQVANGYLKKQQKGKGSIGSDILEKIYKQYVDLSLTWLISGYGEMLDMRGEQDMINLLQEDKHYFSKDERIKILSERITLLEAALADKEKIIAMLEKQAERKK